MDIIETRRENLRRWVAKHGTPAKEKSLFSQLKSTGSFGEKVARRLEEQYKMGIMYLDGAGDAPELADTGAGREGDEVSVGLADSLKLTCETAPELRMLSVYRLANDDGRAAIDSIVEQIRRRLDADGAWKQG